MSPPGQEQPPDAIEAGGGPAADDDDDEFEPLDFDAQSSGSTSVTSSIYRHSYEKGRRCALPLARLDRGRGSS